MEDFQLTNWALLDLQYEYLNDGFKITATTDVPCHLYCRMTKVEPEEHSKPTFRRGLQLPGDVRFCFVVYEDNEQDEAGDTLTHTFYKRAWPYCEHRWFYFIGSINAVDSVSQSCIFHFHFPAPPPEPPPPMHRVFFAQHNNRTILVDHFNWNVAHDAASGTILGNYSPPNYALFGGSYLRGGVHHIWRSFLSFDTSLMSLTANIVNAKLSPYPFNSQGTVTEAIYITKGVQHNPVIPTDYGDQLPITTIGGLKFNVDINSYQDIDLNSDGKSFIIPGGLSRFCIRGQVDVLDVEHAFPYNNFIWYYSEQKGAGYLPTLTVDYYPA